MTQGSARCLHLSHRQHAQPVIRSEQTATPTSFAEVASVTGCADQTAHREYCCIEDTDYKAARCTDSVLRKCCLPVANPQPVAGQRASAPRKLRNNPQRSPRMPRVSLTWPWNHVHNVSRRTQMSRVNEPVIRVWYLCSESIATS